MNEDIDVSNERRRVLRGRGKRDLLRLQNLTKVNNLTIVSFSAHISVPPEVHNVREFFLNSEFFCPWIENFVIFNSILKPSVVAQPIYSNFV